MEAISKLLLAFFELIEAEGRVFREKTACLFLAFTLIVMASLIALGGILTMFAALYCFIAPVLGRVSALLVIGSGAIGLSMLIFIKASSLTRADGK